MKKIAALILALITILCMYPLTAIKSSAAFTGSDKINIVLDPGHGGSNIGAAARGVGEKVYTFKLANLIRDELLKNGSFNVYLTRTGDYDLELYQRAEVANNYNADILISLHFDGSQRASDRGVTAYTSVFDAYAAVSLSQSIAQGVASSVGLSNNGVKRRYDNAGYYWNFEKQWDCQDPSLGTLSDYYGIPTWCAKFGIPSIIVEHGFFSNASDVSLILADGALEKMAKAEAAAIINYYTTHYHTYSAAKRDYPSNCMYTGKQSEHCSYCGHRRNVSLIDPASNNHYWVYKEYKAAACGVDGKVVLECRITQNLKDKGWEGTVHTSTEIIPAPQDHTFEITEDVKATHTVDGYQKWKCKTCSYGFTETIKAEGHTFEFLSYKEPTCTESGGNTYKCKRCSDQYTEKEPAMGHSYEITETIDPTCEKNGEQKKKCSVCRSEASDVLNALGHDLPASATVEPTCTEDGYRRGTCARCNESIDEVIEKKGHAMSSVSETAPTCEIAGEKTLSCTVCGYSEKETVEPSGHYFEITDEKKASCETGGYKLSICSVCGAEKKKTIEPLGHKKSAEGKVTKKATLFESGTCEYPCENGCGKIFSEDIPKTLTSKMKYLIIGSVSAILSALIAAGVIIAIKKSKAKKEEPVEEAKEEAHEKEPSEEK